jgi:hypothetical protein
VQDEDRRIGWAKKTEEAPALSSLRTERD